MQISTSVTSAVDTEPSYRPATSTASSAPGIPPPRDQSELAKQGPHPHTAAIASAICVTVLFLTLLGAFFFRKKRLSRRETGGQSTNTGRDDDGRDSSGTSSIQHILYNSTKQRGIELWETSIRSGPQAALLHNRPATLNLHRPLSGLPVDEMLLMQPNTASPPMIDPATQSCPDSMSGCVENRCVSCTLLDEDNARPTRNGLTSRAMRDSWGSDGSSEEPGQAVSEKSSMGWHPNRMVRPPPGSYRAVASYESGEAVIAL
ncbi:hypothetical protein C8Q70DRAFT_1034309 [Cubamyces menziesii]|nr:hypothetical protein C8Q70DRAFT_1034309 [Cubamyces menziesii]